MKLLFFITYFLKDLFLFMCVFCVNVCHICVGTCGGQKKVSDPPELELQVNVDCLL